MTGSFPPMKCGVGGYTEYLVTALSKREDVQVAVLTDVKASNVTDNIGSRNIFPVVKGDVGDIFRVVNVLHDWKPDVIHFQFPTLGYRTWGRLATILLPMIFSILGVPVVITLHEPIRFAQLFWLNMLVMRGLIVVRPNYLKCAPVWFRQLVNRKRFRFIPNASTIPISQLAYHQVMTIRDELNVGRSSLVVYFGFAFPNKKVEQIFEIANPARDHIALVCDLDPGVPYHKKILEFSENSVWNGRVVVTGFLPAVRVGDILASADAVILPFESGGGVWNTSVHAAVDQGVFLLTTSSLEKHGYVATENVYYARPGDIADMRTALSNYIGCKLDKLRTPHRDRWQEIAEAHVEFYRLCLEKRG